MPELLTFGIMSFSAIFFVVDPFAVIPMFLAITQGDSKEKRTSMALKASVVASLTLVTFSLLGEFIFRLFGITMGAFKIAGGILLFLIAVDMIRAQRSRARTSPEEEAEGMQREDVAVIPLGIPMLAGPGSIATVTVLMSDAGGEFARIVTIILCIAATGGVTFLLLSSATILERALKQTGLNILNRIMGLLLAAVAAQFVVSGIRDVFQDGIAKP